MLQTGERAPDILLPDVHGKVTALEHFYVRPQDPVLVAIFKVSCPTCQFTLPFLERLSRERVQIVGISQDDAAATKAFAAHYHLTFPILVDASPYPVSSGFRVTSVPSMFLIREDGIIEWESAGFIRTEFEELGHRLHISVFRADDPIPEHKAG